MDKTVMNTAEAGRLYRPRLGFLGVGWIGRSRLESLAKSGVVEIAAVADPCAQNCERACRFAPHARRVENLQDLLALPLDAIVIATPSALHAEQACAALSAGLAVFCQKPLALNAQSTRDVIACARKADRLLGVDLSYRYLRGLDRIRQQIAAGVIGNVYAVDLVFHNAYGPDKHWYYDLCASGGGCVIDLGTHMVDLMLHILKNPRLVRISSQLYADGLPLNGHRKVENYAAAQMELENGISARLACSWHLSAGREALIHAIFYGTGGGLGIRNIDGSFYLFQAEQYKGTNCEPLCAPSDDWWGAAAVAWARALCCGRRYDASVEDLVGVAQILDALYAAGGQGHVQPVSQEAATQPIVQ